MNLSLAVLFGVVVCLLPSTMRAQTETARALTKPDASQVIAHLLTVICTDAVSDIHFANEARLRRLAARRYYGTLFVVWFGTQERPEGKVFDLDIRDQIRGFLRAAEKERFASLVDYDDPLSWTRISPDLDRDALISMIGGMPYYRWVLQQTKDTAVYQDAVQRFRTLIATVKAKE